MRTLDCKQACDLLCENKSTLIVFHARPDADAVGSAFALRTVLSALGVAAYCACADEMPERLAFLAEGAPACVRQEDALFSSCERVISVDCASPSQIGPIYEAVADRLVLMIDHHEAGAPYAPAFVRPQAAATGELIYEMAEELLRRGEICSLPLSFYGALYAAISSDTGAFRYSNVTPNTLRVVAALLELGVDGADINHRLYESKSLGQITAEGEAARSLCVSDGGRIASVVFPYKRKKELGLSDEHLETIIDVPRTLRGVQIAFSVRQPEDAPFFRVSMRANGDYDVSRVCASFGGGGHRRAAGCGIEAADADEVRRIVTEAIRTQKFF